MGPHGIAVDLGVHDLGDGEFPELLQGGGRVDEDGLGAGPGDCGLFLAGLGSGLGFGCVSCDGDLEGGRELGVVDPVAVVVVAGGHAWVLVVVEQAGVGFAEELGDQGGGP